jgi:hypothetical protein
VGRTDAIDPKRTSNLQAAQRMLNHPKSDTPARR